MAALNLRDKHVKLPVIEFGPRERQQPVAESAEQAVRDYLTALQEPDKLRDSERVNELTQRLEATDDPLERLQLRAELALAQAPDTDALERDFVTYAKQWAAEKGVTAAAFQQEGVPRNVLRRAGLDGGRGRGRTRLPTRTRRPRVSREDVQKAIPPRKPFTIADLASASGGSTATVRKVVTDLMAEGKVEEAGTAEGHQGSGSCSDGLQALEEVDSRPALAA